MVYSLVYSEVKQSVTAGLLVVNTLIQPDKGIIIQWKMSIINPLSGYVPGAVTLNAGHLPNWKNFFFDSFPKGRSRTNSDHVGSFSLRVKPLVSIATQFHPHCEGTRN